VTEKVVGSVSIKPTDTAPREAEVGFKLNRLYQRQGLATEAARAFLEHAFSTGVSRVFAVVDTRNSACVALLERIGMTRERHIRRSCFVKGEWCDEYVYALDKNPG
jgi:RimJ/RimL family protein N-acetyltransferase